MCEYSDGNGEIEGEERVRFYRQSPNRASPLGRLAPGSKLYYTNPAQQFPLWSW